ncbi:hypothetical protein [uncultured Paracoccus sp.]|uniref:hypothetical protein n=1 Tax=uncultured Paracoccus sp. TaxID=189685 RepID=UPI002613CD7C|nr:hypothetical protein [uncultured Paracoccus sp.]
MWRKRHLPNEAFPSTFPVFGPGGELLAQIESVAAAGAGIEVTGWAASMEVGLWSGNRALQTLRRPSRLGAAGSTNLADARLRFRLKIESRATPTYLYLRTKQHVHYVQLGV